MEPIGSIVFLLCTIMLTNVTLGGGHFKVIFKFHNLLIKKYFQHIYLWSFEL